MTKMVAQGSYHRTPCPSGASPPLPCQGQHGGERGSRRQEPGTLGIQGTFPLWLSRQEPSLSVPRQEPPGGVVKSHPGCWGHHQPARTGCIHFYCTLVLALVG